MDCRILGRDPVQSTISRMESRSSSERGASSVEQLLQDRSGVAAGLAQEVLQRARERADGLLTPDRQTASFGLAMLAGCAMSSLWLDAAWDTRAASVLADELCEITGAPKALIGIQALGNPDLLALPLMALASVQLEVLVVFAELDHASLWTASETEPEAMACRGITLPPDGVKAAAAALAGRLPTQAHRRTAVISRWQRGHAALIAEGPRVAAAEPLLLQ